jgi:hypothetical protein
MYIHIIRSHISAWAQGNPVAPSHVFTYKKQKPAALIIHNMCTQSSCSRSRRDVRIPGSKTLGRRLQLGELLRVDGVHILHIIRKSASKLHLRRHTQACVFFPSSIYMYKYTHIHTYIHTHTHTHTHTYDLNLYPQIRLYMQTCTGGHSRFYYTSTQSAPSQKTSHDSDTLRHW